MLSSINIRFEWFNSDKFSLALLLSFFLLLTMVVKVNNCEHFYHDFLQKKLGTKAYDKTRSQTHALTSFIRTQFLPVQHTAEARG